MIPLRRDFGQRHRKLGFDTPSREASGAARQCRQGEESDQACHEKAQREDHDGVNQGCAFPKT
jgi:hypothetical protein